MSFSTISVDWRVLKWDRKVEYVKWCFGYVEDPGEWETLVAVYQEPGYCLHVYGFYISAPEGNKYAIVYYDSGAGGTVTIPIEIPNKGTVVYAHGAPFNTSRLLEAYLKIVNPGSGSYFGGLLIGFEKCPAPR